MDYTKIIENDVCKVNISGKFTFTDHLEFKKILSIFEQENIAFLEVNLSEVTFVDSAALGLLLLVRDESEKHSVKLTVFKPQGQVQKMFKISRFYELFNVVD